MPGRVRTGREPPNLSPVAKRYAWYVLGVMFAINFLNYLDRYVLPAAASSIQKEFHIDDTAMGAVLSAFLLFYSLTVLPFGYWADRGVRKNVIGAGVTIWSLATLLTGMTQNVYQLFAARAVLGIGEAGYFPAGTSLLGDFFAKPIRSRAASIWNSGSVFGIAVGFIAGGIVAQHFGWRWAFYGTAIPGLICAVLAFRLREPARGAAEAVGPTVRRPHDLDFRAFVGLLRIPSFRATVVSQVLLYAVLAAIANWLPTYIQRRYGLSVSGAATLGGGVLIGGGLAGTLIGGWLGDWRARHTPRGYLEIAAASFVAGAVLLVAALQARSLSAFVPLALLSAAVLYLYVAPFTALQQNVIVPTLRASAITLGLFLGHLLGDSWSPWAVGVLSDAFGSLSLALTFMAPPLLLLAALAAASGLPHAARDIENMEKAWAAHFDQSVA
jgi:sugar phosphate permease